MRRTGAKLIPLVVLVVIGSACFARLIADPTGLIVDGTRSSVDFANRGDSRPVGNDLTFVFWPHHLSVAKILREFGHPPMWDSSGFGGRPMVGNPQSGLFYPPAWIAWWACSPSSLGWLTVGHLLWGGLGLYLLARGQGQGRWPATVAAGCFQASPYLLAQTFEGHHPHVWAACWFPWAFWAFAEFRKGRARGWLALPPILALTYLTGHPQEWFLLLTALSLWVAADMVSILRKRDEQGGRGLALLLGWAGILALCVGMAAVEIVPASQVLPWVQIGPQGEGASGIARNYQLHLVNLLQLLSPRALGGPDDYFGHDNYWESVLSFGLVTLVLIGAGTGLSRRRSKVRGWLAMVLLAVWFAAGRQLGLLTALSWLVPGMSWFRVPARSLFLASVGTAVLAGFGVEALQERLGQAGQWRRFAVQLGRIGLVVIGMLLLFNRAGSPNPQGWQTDSVPAFRNASIAATAGELPCPASTLPVKSVERVSRAAGRILQDPPFWAAAAMIGLVVGLGFLDNRRPIRGHAVFLLGLLAMAELAWHGFTLIQVASAERLVRPDPISESLILADTALTEREPFRVRARDAFYLDLDAARYEIEKTNINDVFQLGHAAALYGTLYQVATRTPSSPAARTSPVVDNERRQVRQGVFDRMAVAYLVSDRVEPDPPWPVAATGNRDGKSYVIQRNPTAMPRAYVVPRAEIVDDDPAIILSRFRSSDPRSAVLMATDPLASLPAGPRQPFTPACWICRDPDLPVLAVTTTAPGLLVMADTWMPGWSARVDNRAVPILAGNHAQRVLPLEQPGRHVVELRYQPPGLAIGFAISMMSVLAWCAFSVVMPWLSGRHQHQSLASLDQPDSRLDELWSIEAENRLMAFADGRKAAIPAGVVIAEFDAVSSIGQ